MRSTTAPIIACAALAACAEAPGVTTAPDLAVRPARSGRAPVNATATARVTGRALAAVVSPGAAAAGFAPLAAARVTLYRDVGAEGQGVVRPVAEGTTGPDGAFAFDGVPRGLYVVVLNAAPGRTFGDAMTSVLCDTACASGELRVRYRASALGER